MILGSGVVGVACAYFLAKDGHEVTVLDRQPAAGLETSFANAGEISPGYASPWASPGLLWRVARWMLGRHSPLVVRPQPEPVMWRFMLQMLANARPDRYAVNKERMLRLAHYSRKCLEALREETGIQYDARLRGTLQLFRSHAALREARRDMEVLDRFGVPYRLLDAQGCVAAEPGLARVVHKIAGGLQLPGDETGDCFKFTQGLAALAEKAGARFRYRTTIRRLATDGDRIAGVDTDDGRAAADAYVLAMGSYSPLLLRPLGIVLPVYPVKGYSATIPVKQDDAAPVSTIMDESHKVAITRLGDRIRAAGTAELAGYDLRLRLRRCGMILHVVQDLFPAGGDDSKVTFWTGLRPMTPDGPPVLGATPYKNLYLNTGHGTLGWTMACGSGRVVADLVGGRRPAIDTAGLTLERYG